MTAAKAMVLARLGFADDGVSVGNFAFCHLREATILAFDTALSGRHLAFSHNAKPMENKWPRINTKSANHLFRFEFVSIREIRGDQFSIG